MIYLDHAATTQIDKEVLKAMTPFLTAQFGNAGGIYELGRTAKEALEDARKTVAKALGAKSQEIYFTSGGTEGDNLAILGFARKNQLKGNGSARPAERGKLTTGGHIITTNIEHHAVLQPCRVLEKEGFKVIYLPVAQDGLISADQVKKSIQKETILVTINYANNEIGTVQPIGEIGKTIKEINHQREDRGLPKIAFHTDACQAAGFLNLNVTDLGVDMLTLNGSKIYGPKGVGALYIRTGIELQPLVYGGGQERNWRSGTENIAGIVGLAKALELGQKDRKRESERLSKLRDYFIGRLLKEIPKTALNGHAIKRLPNNVNVSILDIEGEAVVLSLDTKGVAAATGSACTAKDLEPSHVILALEKPYEYAHGSLRFTLGKDSTKKELDYVMEILPSIVERLRKMSAVDIKIKKKYEKAKSKKPLPRGCL